MTNWVSSSRRADAEVAIATGSHSCPRNFSVENIGCDWRVAAVALDRGGIGHDLFPKGCSEVLDQKCTMRANLHRTFGNTQCMKG